jgi:hypothetical protein
MFIKMETLVYHVAAENVSKEFLRGVITASTNERNRFRAAQVENFGSNLLLSSSL